MARVKDNLLLKGLSGRLGDLIFRNVGSKTVVTPIPKRKKRQTASQGETRSRFRLATAYAKTSMLDEEKKAYFQKVAKKCKLPNAYTAAIREFLSANPSPVKGTKRGKAQPSGDVSVLIFSKDGKRLNIRHEVTYSERTIEFSPATALPAKSTVRIVLKH